MALATRPKPSAHHKKRVGRHHKHNKQYLSHYWPYLPMLLIVGLGLFVNDAWAAHSVLADVSDFSSTSLLNDTNANRTQDNEAPLTIDAKLTAAAQAKANDMVAKDYWAHNSPTGVTPWDFITAAGYQYLAAGENLAYGFDNADQAVIGWMNSPEHRANILNVSYQNVGFGVASSQNYQGQGPQIIVVAEYGDPVSAPAPKPATSTKAAKTTKTTPVAETPPVNIPAPAPTPAPTTTATDSGSAGVTDNNVAANRDINAQPVSRIQLLTGGQASWSMFAVSVIASSAFMIFILRHGFGLRKMLVKGEVWVMHHPLLDIAVVFIFTAGFVLSRSTGMIR